MLLAFLGYKVFLLNKYKANERTLDTNTIFIETVTISNDKEVDDVITYEELSIKNWFNEFEEHKTNSNLKAKYDAEGNVVSAYSISKENQYVNLLDSLKNDNIKNDIDLLKYVKDNYFIKNTIFTSKKTMETNYSINYFVDNALPEFESISLINGNITGYIINMKNVNTREIHLLYNNEQYILSLFGEDITNTEFITNLLETVKFNG